MVATTTRAEALARAVEIEAERTRGPGESLTRAVDRVLNAATVDEATARRLAETARMLMSRAA